MLPLGRRLRIGIVAVRAANSMQSWRGVIRSLAQALEKAGAEVICIELSDGITGRLYRLKELFVRRVIGRRYQRHREPFVLRAYGRAMDRAIARHRIDVAISLKAIPMSHSKTAVPVILYNDAPFSGLLNFYAEFTGMSPGHVADGHAMERATARKAARSIYTSQWAADLAVRDYGVDPSSVHVVPVGANLEVRHARSDVEGWIEQRVQSQLWECFWLGVDWERKRGALAVRIIEELRRRGYPVHLTVAGAGPKKSPSATPGVTYLPFLDAAGIVQKLKGTHFLLFPTLADCTPIVYSEANAFGVPVLSTNVGGITTSLKEGRNGHVFAIDAPVSVWADRIERYMNHHESYHRIALSSYDEYASRLNWDIAGKRIFAIAASLTGEQAVW